MKATVESLIVSRAFHGQRVDVVLAQLFPEYSRSKLTYWLKNGAITVDQRQCKPKDKIQGGECVTLQILPAPVDADMLAEDIPLHVIFEDDELLVVNKPADLVVHPGAGNSEHTLVNALLFHDSTLSHLPRAGIVHRLDKDTTGLMVVAKTLSTHTDLVRKMQARDITRHYSALVYGPIISGGTIDTCYGRHPRNRLKMAVCKQGRQAVTHYTINKHYQYVTLLDVKLMTGRTHQIRVHMAHINHPVVGDPLYGGRARIPARINDCVRLALQQFKRQALHACTLSFKHPKTQADLTFTAPLPDDFKSLLAILEANYE